MGRIPRFAALSWSTHTRCLLALGLLLLALATLFATSNQAGAAEAPAFLTQFGENCSSNGGEKKCCSGDEIAEGKCGKAGQTAVPNGIATDPDTGHLFVADQINRRIDEFTPWGGWIKAFGWDVAPGAVDEEQEIRIKASAGQFKLSFEANTTPNLPFNASEEEVEAALNGLASISSKGSVSVEEVVGNPNGTTPFIYLISFDGGSLKASDVPQIGVADGTTPLSGGDPAPSKDARTRANGAVAGTGFETCTTGSECKAGVPGDGVGQFGFGSPQGIAVDSDGDVYAVDWENHRIQKFDSAGEFLWMVGGGVDPGPNHPGNLCTAAFIAEGDACGAGSEGTGLGEFSNWPFSSFIAIGPGDTIYVGDKERIQRFDPDGTPLTPISLPAPIDKGTVSSLAVTPAGEIYVSIINTSDVFHLDSAGSKLCTIEVGRPTALALAGSDGVYVFADRIVESEANKDPEVRQYNSDCAQVGSFAKNEFGGSTGIGVNGLGNVYVSNRSDAGKNSYIRAYGPAPIDYESPPLIPPEIVAEYAISVRADSATVGAQINPKFWTDATYYVQYGSEDCAKPGAECKNQPLAPGTPLTTASISTPVATAGVELSGLAPNATYHYRFVAVSSGGGPVIGDDETFRTYAGSEPPADNRVSELVSPPLKDGGEVGVPTGPGGGAELSVQPQQSSPLGEAMTYASFTAFGENAESAPAASQYLSRPVGAGSWSTDNVNPRFEEGFTRDPFVGFSEDLSRAAVIVLEPPLTPDSTEGFPNLYLRDNDTGVLTAVTTADHSPEISISKPKYCLYLGGASRDFSRVFFGANGALIAGDPVIDNFNLYEWSAAEGLRLVSVLPNGENALSGGGFGRGVSGDCKTEGAVLRHAVSADGSRVFWTYSGTYLGAKSPLLARIDGGETVQLDAGQGAGTGKGGGNYQDASADGSKVFFTDANILTSQSTTVGSTDLYRYDFDKEVGERLTNLTAKVGEKANVGAVIGASEDGSYVYFTASGVLDAEPNPRGETAKAGQNNLYSWHGADGIRFLAGLVGGESTGRLSPDGRSLTFLSRNPLTGFENTVVGAPGCQLGQDGLFGAPECAEAFLYDYPADSLVCASCGLSGARPHGPAVLPASSVPYQQPRYLSDDGRRLFFETLDALDPHDTNDKRDVYEFEKAGAGSCTALSPAYTPATNACIFLISTGKSGDQSYFLDASNNGDHAFFSTRQSLVFTDLDDRYDVYDARVGGSLPPPVPKICESEDCRNAPTLPPPPAPAGTPGVDGPGDPTPTRKPPRKCPKGTHKRKGKCVKAKVHKTHKDNHRKGRAVR